MLINNTLCSGLRVNFERFNSPREMWDVSQTRPCVDSRFREEKLDSIESIKRYIKEDPHFIGVDTFEEALNLLDYGYRPVVDAFKSDGELTISGSDKRFRQTQEVQGFAPIVPLALMGVPNCMMNMRMRPIKGKVLNVIYDIGATAMVSADSVIKAGKALLKTLMLLEMKGYRFNLWATKSQTRDGDDQVDMCLIKIKSSNTPLDLTRMSFPLAHPAFFRVFCWYWYAHKPEAKFRSGLGRSLSYVYPADKLNQFYSEILKEPCVFFSLKEILDLGTGRREQYIADEITGGTK